MLIINHINSMEKVRLPDTVEVHNLIGEQNNANIGTVDVKDISFDRPNFDMGNPLFKIEKVEQKIDQQVNYHYPKANPANSVLTNIKDLAEQGVYAGFHDYVRQSVAQKCMLAEVEAISITQKLWHWLRDIPTEEQVAQSLKGLNDIDMGYQSLVKLSKKTTSDDALHQENQAFLIKNRLTRLQHIVDFSELSLKYVQKNSSANPQFKNELIGVLFTLSKEFDAEDIKQLDSDSSQKNKFLTNIQKIALSLSAIR